MFRGAAAVEAANQAGQAGTRVSPIVSSFRRTAHAASASASERPKIGYRPVSMAHRGKSSSDPSPNSSQDATAERAMKKVPNPKALKQMSPLPMVENGHT